MNYIEGETGKVMSGCRASVIEYSEEVEKGKR